MKHYVCKGECRGESAEKKACGMKSCSRFGKELSECDCVDGQHERK